ncbi:MAG TPA: tetratricopeptide repeat protein [Phycisphaerae bacterium]|nr:tetratricopeptide repeat protein [Phycisphaerae bacterium]HRW52499.1 tetratricopeptide repeat protein [Phycisphaerae bacterium]
MAHWILLLLATTSLALPPKKKPETLPGYDWTTPPKRARGEPAPPPLPADQVVGEFLARIATSESYDAKSRAFVSEQGAALDDERVSGFLTSAYSVLSPDFAKGLDSIDDERIEDAATTFERLSSSDDPYLAVAAANMGATAMIEMDQVDRCLDMLDRVRKAHTPIERYTTASDHFRFMLGYCQVHNLEYAEAYATFEDFLNNHPNAPERLIVGARQILTELDRRAPGRIGDVRDIMHYARRKISNGHIDDALMKKQREAVTLLDSLIEEAEDKEQQGQGGGDGGGSGKGGGSSGGDNPGGGAQRSTKPQGAGDTGELRRQRARPGEMWGKMPPRDREELLQTLQKQFPSQYRELLEQYYKQLAKDAPSE